jgi:hypothetical protein
MKEGFTKIGWALAALVFVGAGCGLGTATRTETQVNVNSEAGGADAMEKSGGEAETGMEKKDDAMMKAEGSMQAGARASANARMDAVREGIARVDQALQAGEKTALWAAAKAELNAKMAAVAIKLEAMAAVEDTGEEWERLKAELEALLTELEMAWAEADAEFSAGGSMEGGTN